MKKMRFRKKMLIFACMLVLMLSYSTAAKASPAKKIVSNQVMLAKESYYLYLDSGDTNISGKVKWSTSNKNIVKIEKSTNKKCRVKAQKNGNATVTAKVSGITIQFKIKVYSSDNAFVKAWCKNWVKNNIKKDMTFKEKLILASGLVTYNGVYGDYYTAKDMIIEGKGTCLGGSRLVAELCKAMGYPAKARFAAKDNMSRYPQGVFFASQHYNVEVTVKGKKYYIDGNPGICLVYLSSAKAPIYYQVLGFTIINK